MHATLVHNHSFPGALTFAVALMLVLLTSCIPKTSIPIVQMTPAPPIPVDADSRWTSYTSTKNVRDIEQDISGNIWVATGGGAVRWNLIDNTYTHFTTASGLASNDVVDIEIDTNGRVWLTSSTEGISVFDGNSWRIYAGPSGLLPSNIRAIESDSTGRLYIGSFDNGVCILESNGFCTSLYKDDENAPDRVDLLQMAPDGTLWAVGAKKETRGVFHLDGSIWTVYPVQAFISTLVITSENVAWIGTSGEGLFYLDGLTWLPERPRIFGERSSWTLSLSATGEHTIWGVNDVGVFQSDDNGRNWLHRLDNTERIMPSIVTVVFPMSDNTVWFGTFADGIYRFEGKPDHLGNTQLWTHFMIPNEPSHHTVRALDFAEDGTGWFATDGGIARFNGEAWDHLVVCAECPKKGYWEEEYWSIAVTDDGSVWAGSRTQGVSRFDKSRWRTFKEKDGLVSNSYNYGLAISPDNTVWFGSGSGISIYKNGEWTAKSDRSNIYDDVQAIAVAPDESLWFGRWKGGLSRLDPREGTWRVYTVADGLADHDIHAIAVDAQNTVWIGTNSGVSRFDGSTWHTFTADDGLAENNVHAIAIDADGGLWFGTRSAGVSFFDGTSWIHYSTQDGLASNKVHAIRIAPDGAVWFVTESGISRFCPEQRETCRRP